MKNSPIDWLKTQVRRDIASHGAKLQTAVNMKTHPGSGIPKIEDENGQLFFVAGKSQVGGNDIVRGQ